jgi:NAD+ synthase
MEMNSMEKISKDISNWLENYLRENKMNCFVVGVSGGIDSALVSTLCAQTGIKTYIVSMPIHQKYDQLERARNHAEWLMDRYSNVEFLEFDLTEVFDLFASMFTDKKELSLANSRSRLRMVTLYQISGDNHGLVVGTGNKVEDFGIGFFTKYGDGGVDISPIADLTKTEVRMIAEELGIIDEILKAKPTDGLWEDDRSDEDQIGASYNELEWAMNFDGNINDCSDNQKRVYEIYKKFNKVNNHKMVSIPIWKKNK